MTATKPKKKMYSDVSDIERLQTELDEARKELSLLDRFLEKIQEFSSIVGKAKTELKQLQAEEHELAKQLQEVRSDIKSMKELINSSNNGMISMIEPGPKEFMPLFDRMDKADPVKHGTNAVKWREQPLSVLKLSPASTALLYEAAILFVGQLQDRILADADEWWIEIDGLTFPIAAAIADKLADFTKKGGDV